MWLVLPLFSILPLDFVVKASQRGLSPSSNDFLVLGAKSWSTLSYLLRVFPCAQSRFVLFFLSRSEVVVHYLSLIGSQMTLYMHLVFFSLFLQQCFAGLLKTLCSLL